MTRLLLVVSLCGSVNVGSYPITLKSTYVHAHSTGFLTLDQWIACTEAPGQDALFCSGPPKLCLGGQLATVACVRHAWPSNALNGVKEACPASLLSDL